MRKPIRFTSITAILVVAALIIALACLLAKVAPIDNVWLNYWLAVFSGNWSAGAFADRTHFGELWIYWIGVLLALGFNIGAVSLLVTLVSSLTFVKRSYAMNLMQAFDVREADIKHEILVNVPEHDFEALRPVIERAFAQGAKVWREQTLVTLLGARGAKKLLDNLSATQLPEQE
jgi:hypothetical protein